MDKQQIRDGGWGINFYLQVGSKLLVSGIVGGAIVLGYPIPSEANPDSIYDGSVDSFFPSSGTEPFVYGQALPAPTLLPPSAPPVDLTYQRSDLPAVGIPLAPYGSPPPSSMGAGGGSSLTANALNYVIVDSRDTLVLQQVRAIEPRAYFKPLANGQTVIQAGAFTSFTRAEQRVRELQGAGIGNVTLAIAEGGDPFVTPGFPTTPNPDTGIGVVPVTPTPTFPGTPTDLSYRPSIPLNANAYYVVVPTRREDLTATGRRIVQLGQNSLSYGAIQARLSPRGPHVAVGPFTERGSAETWTRYLREVGQLDARVFYGRYDSQSAINF
ncbi:MAG: hypothetical protein SFW36_07115 [Leptolyngbyaceae cyanobacterium bins.59]|nr:hypothetical protein [Leptolyngbyaceae cyanobacterium bins.59]